MSRLESQRLEPLAPLDAYPLKLATSLVEIERFGVHE